MTETQRLEKARQLLLWMLRAFPHACTSFIPCGCEKCRVTEAIKGFLKEEWAKMAQEGEMP